MKILDNFKLWVGNKILAATQRDKTGWFVEWALRGSRTSSGENVSNNSALQLGTVFACIRNISEDVAKIPFKVYRPLKPRGKEPQPVHRLYKILHDEPNSEMTSSVFRQTLTAHCLSWGNGYAEIQRDTRGAVVALWPLRPDKVMPFRNDVDSLIWYEVSTDSGEKYYIRYDNVLHIPGMAFDGLVGYNVVRYARECIGGALAAQKFASAFYRNNATPGGILTHPETLTIPAQDRLRSSMEKQMSGAENASRLLVIEEGMTFKQLTIPPEEAQFLETRQFNVPEICRWFRMPPGKVGDTTRAQGWSTLEMTNTDYVTDTLLPWLVRWEQEVKRKLFSPRDKVAGYYAKHVVNGLLRGDVKSRTEAYVRGRNWGWLSADDVRELEDMNPLPDGQGEKYLIPLNMRDAVAKDDYPATAAQFIDELKAEKAQLEGELKAAKTRSVKYQVALKEKEAEVASLEDQLVSATADTNTKREEISQLKDERTKLAADLDDARSQAKAAAVEVASLKDQIVSVTTDLEATYAWAKAADTQVNELKEREVEHKTELEQKDAALQEKQLEREADLKANKEKLEAVNIEKAQSEKELAEAKAACDTASELIVSLKTELETVKAKAIKNDEEIKQFEADLQIVKENVEAAEIVKLQLEKDLAESETKNAGLINKNTTIQKDLDAANTTIDVHEKEKAQLNDKIKNAKAQAKLWKGRREELNSKLIDDAAERIANAEIEALKSRITKATENKGRWRDFVCEFYTKHGAYIERTLSPITNKNKNIAKVLIAEGIKVFTGTDPESALDRWAVNRSSQIADLLRKELEC